MFIFEGVGLAFVKSSAIKGHRVMVLLDAVP